MSNAATLSILGMYNYDSTIFNGLILPSGVDKQIVIDQICFECSDLEVLYPDPEYLKRAITLWSYANQKSWESMCRALESEYNPIENYDRHEDSSDTGHGVNSGSSSGTVTARATSFESDTPKVTDSNSSDSSGTNTSESVYKHTSHIHGNIGVTTSQQMLESELKLRMTYNFTMIIVNSFKQNFTIMVY